MTYTIQRVSGKWRVWIFGKDPDVGTFTQLWDRPFDRKRDAVKAVRAAFQLV